MVTRYTRLKMKFACVSFGTAVRRRMSELSLTAREIDVLAGYGYGNTQKFAAHMKPNPEMNTFLACCNALDLNPGDYFILDD